MGDILGGNPRSGPGSVLDDDLLTEPRLRRLGKETPDYIGRRTGRETDDEVDRTRRIGLGPSEARDSRQRGCTCGQVEDLSTGRFIVMPSRVLGTSGWGSPPEVAVRYLLSAFTSCGHSPASADDREC